MGRALAFALALSMCIAYVAAHGFLVTPMSRPKLWSDPPIYRFAAGYNGGGPKYIGTTGHWPNGKPGSMCGDEPGKWEQMTYGPITAKYKAGATIPVDIVIWNWHGGRVENFVCNKGTTKINAKQCKRLTRAQGMSKNYFYTPRLDGPENAKAYPQTDWDHKKNPFTWYRYKSDNMFNNAVVLRTMWKLPKNFRCPGGCVFVWKWTTRTTCIPTPCEKADPFYSNKCQPWGQALKYCNQPNAEYPEEFFNCADVKIA